MRRLIVNADDFGLTPGVSQGILAAHRHGIVTSTTLLVTRPIERGLLDRLLDTDLGTGLHVNLTLGRPLTSASSLTGDDGLFVREPHRVAGDAKLADIAREVTAQVEAFQRLLARLPGHLDSHHHVGMLEPVRSVLLDTARAVGAPVRSQDGSARAAALAAGLRTTDHFFGGSGPDAYWTIGRALGHLRDLPPGTSEFMAHPGYFDDTLSYSRYGRQRETELIGIGSSTTRVAALSLGIRLVTFRDLV
jgi:predicted glycoside hydrolase/deacetylase ChbG (UPF0249 family)